MEYEPFEKCHFRDTVDLSQHLPLENGSYIYDDILIEANQTAFYRHQLTFLDKSEKTALHRRGCVCDWSKGRACMKLCCERGKFFNQTSHRCEKLAPKQAMPTDMEILLQNKTRTIWNIFNHFIIQIGRPCEKLEVIKMHVDPWVLKENGTLAIATDNITLDTVNYCISPQLNKTLNKTTLLAMSCPMRNDPSLSMVLNTYISFPSSHNLHISLYIISFSVFIILRLFLIMGICWIMDIISYCCRNYKVLDFLFGITDFCNASQGVLIFFMFIYRREVLIALKEQ
ncbi:G-protein coupled receptor Mth2-like [Musca vetustissima]|uniref:G-protein coupled receptor Mth2-like n=1 Tax=Musca vetustissima TaxID=27455 RepID=UPI002AB6BC41|nr:G-protein coupled receptor Mth2-like [Musca vetustissima]